MTVQMEQSLEGCLSAAAVTVLSAESGGMCLSLVLSVLGSCWESRTVAGTCPFVPTCGKGQVPKPRGGVFLVLHCCQSRDQPLLQPLALPQGLFESLPCHCMRLKQKGWHTLTCCHPPLAHRTMRSSTWALPPCRTRSTGNP